VSWWFLGWCGLGWWWWLCEWFWGRGVSGMLLCGRMVFSGMMFSWVFSGMMVFGLSGFDGGCGCVVDEI